MNWFSRTEWQVIDELLDDDDNKRFGKLLLLFVVSAFELVLVFLLLSLILLPKLPLWSMPRAFIDGIWFVWVCCCCCTVVFVAAAVACVVFDDDDAVIVAAFVGGLFVKTSCLASCGSCWVKLRSWAANWPS